MTMIHRLALAAALLCAPVLNSRAAAAPPDQPTVEPDSPAIYLGTTDAAGVWLACNVDPAPVVDLRATSQPLEQPLTVQITTGLRLRSAPTAAAEEVGRRREGSTLQLHRLHASGAGDRYYVWAYVDRHKLAEASPRLQPLDTRRAHLQHRLDPVHPAPDRYARGPWLDAGRSPRT